MNLNEIKKKMSQYEDVVFIYAHIIRDKAAEIDTRHLHVSLTDGTRMVVDIEKDIIDFIPNDKDQGLESNDIFLVLSTEKYKILQNPDQTPSPCAAILSLELEGEDIKMNHFKIIKS